VSSRLLVLGWHNIDPTGGFPGTTPERARRVFSQQVWLLTRFTNVVPLRSALTDLAEGRPLPPRAVALTFDDGYLDNATFAAPMLNAAGLPATFFLVPGFLSGSAPVWWEELGRAFADATAAEVRWGDRRHDTSSPDARRSAFYQLGLELKEIDSSDRAAAVAELRSRLAPAPAPAQSRLFMDWDEAGRLTELGHDIGSHTCSHPIMSQETSATQARELIESRRDLEAHFQRSVDVLAFPNGRVVDYSAETLRLTREAGYAFAVTTRTAIAGPDTAPAEVPRVLVDAETDLRELVRKGLRVAKRALPGVGRRD